MCGICGAIGIEDKETAEAVVRRMMAAIVHRGPDEEGIVVAPQVAAGIERLSIIDLAGGSQPMWNHTKTLAVVFNGEIYNFRGLRKDLESRGHKFHTRSDTEVILQAYEAWGPDCVSRLEGMFAFAVMEFPGGGESRPARVFLARDRMGIKPLYYTVQAGVFCFASEVRALLASGYVRAKLAPAAIPAYLLLGSVCEPDTLIEGVKSLPPGECLTIPIRGSLEGAEPKPFWDFVGGREAQARSSHESSSDAPSRVRALLEDSVRSHLVADVPVGVFLSSGLDSTALAALASRVHGGIHTFTVAFPELDFSEAKEARASAERLGTDHREFALSDRELLEKLDHAVAAFDQPSMDGINTYFVSWAARQAGLKVALSGLGSDELFGGYQSFRATRQVAKISAAARYFPGPLRAFAANHLAPATDASRKAMAAWLEPEGLPHSYFFARSLFPPPAAASLSQQDAASWKKSAWWAWLSAAASQARRMDRFTAVSWLELRSYLLNTLLRDTDAMSMAHSLEVRVPFLDSRLVEHVLALPEHEKRRGGRPKSLLIAALEDLLPERLLAQPKRTFTFPWERWLRGPLGKRVEAGLATWSPALEPHIDASHPSGVWNEFLRGHTTWSRPWALYVLNDWAKRNLCGRETQSEKRGHSAAVSAA
ncbi:MAG TPA: asparagine synthase (glutamine-hydrolyzing) [Candidatus Sulfotelmatobacter sp.]|nr:asparagine synthase (glutamine-hydrolyzing) [Candidatus Sulfotelmatobacter sp.]